ncbi:translation initiation factor IF-6 [Candidatus Woesearchaeota archaeon]|nr:translation initiation factor IF-6 [Candidatus Woesearchaeota archaeon]
MHVLKTSFHQNSNVGLYAYTNDKFCLLSSMVPGKLEKDIKEALKVDLIRTNLCGTVLNGIFAAGNNKGLLLPHIVLDSELETLRNHKIKFEIITTDHTALNNNIVVNDQAALVSPDLEEHMDAIKKFLKLKKIEIFHLNKMPTVGALIVLGKKGCLVSKFASDKEMDFVADYFKMPVTRGSVNLGSPYISSGLVVNKHGFIVGERTGGPETVHIDEALGFLSK